MNEKHSLLKNLLSGMESVLVAYSGGVDSTLLLKIARDVLGDRAAGLIVISPTLPKRELKEAREIAREHGFQLIEAASREMDLPSFTTNSERRCYFCKDHRYRMLNQYAAENGYQNLIDGGNADDLGDYRPGLQAAQEQKVRSPLQEVGFSKSEIRELARELNLPNWNKPSSACLASRIPYGTEITPSLLHQVEIAENYIFELGFTEFRVRHHGEIARIEINPENFEKLINHRLDIIQALKDLGFLYITLDLKGFRSGSLNEGISTHG
jgi:uncharacterized protein